MTDQPGANQPQLNLSDPGQGPQLALVLEPDLKSMHLRIGRDGKLMAGIVLSADHLEGLIGNLTQIRERMLPAPPARTTVPEPAATPPTTAAPPPAEPAPTEFTPGIAREIKGTHYDFGLSDNGQQLIFSVRDENLGWLSFRFGTRLLERMLKVVKTASRQ
jgi:hypothetical protein